MVAEEAKISGTVILLLDEIHRLTKPKQDFLLPHLEKGSIILIGATAGKQIAIAGRQGICYNNKNENCKG